MVLQIISNNSYRILGVFTNSSKKDIERNKSRFAALLRVNKPVPSQPSDLNNLLPNVDRSLDNIDKAESHLSISKGKIAQNLFWFANMDATDDECITLLSNNKFEDAINRWKTSGSISSLQGIMVCHLIKERYREAVLLAHNILSIHFKEWQELFSLLPDTTPNDVAHIFLDSIHNEIPKDFTSMDWSGLPEDWEMYIKKKTVTPIAENINSLVETCKASNKDCPEERYNDATTLYQKAKPLLEQLEELLKPNDLLLQSCEDKVYNEILNCSIASYNAAYDKLTHGNESLFRKVATTCNELINNINTKFLSPNVAKRVSENKTIINGKCAQLEKTITESIAFSDNVCWFCGSQEGNLELKKPYSYSVQSGNMRTTYTKTVTIHLCKECQEELHNQKMWKYLTSLMFFALIALIVLLFTDIWVDLEELGWIFPVLLTAGASLGLGFATGGLFRKLFDKKNIRHFDRELDDHPLVKLVKSEGYH